MRADGVPAPTVPRGRTWGWVVLILVAVTAVAGIGAYLTAARPGGRMDPESTSPEGAHALVALLRGYGVEVDVAGTIDDVQRAARPDTLLVVAQTQFLRDQDQLRRLGSTPADLLLVEPTSRARGELAPGLRSGGTSRLDTKPNCSLREANQAGSAQFGPSNTYKSAGRQALTRCYDGVLVRYRDGNRTITVVGNTAFMTNSGLLREGNAALAMNLAGNRARVVWYAPQSTHDKSASSATIFDLIPKNVTFLVWQLLLVVLLLALWKGRRLGPLVAENLPVVVRASETVEGRGRLYRSRRALDRAAQALRTATLQRLLPRLGLSGNAPPTTVALAIAQRSGVDPQSLHHTMFGPPPMTDADLVHLAHALDDIERQVAHL